MNSQFLCRRIASAVIPCAVIALFASDCHSGLLNRRAARSEPSDPSAIRFHQTASSAAPEAILPPASQSIAVQPSCIIYKMHKPGRSFCCDCPPPMKAVLLVQNPQDRCCYAIPVCLPGCCDGPPTIDCRNGLFRRGIVHYRWCCGFEVKIVFRARGDVVVQYFGNYN